MQQQETTTIIEFASDLPIFTIGQVAKQCNLSEFSIRRLVDAGILGYSRNGKMKVFTARELKKAMEISQLKKEGITIASLINNYHKDKKTIRKTIKIMEEVILG